IRDEAKLKLFLAGPGGTLDTTFADNGILVYDVISDRYDVPQGLAIDAHGRPIVSGVTQGADPWVGWVLRFTVSGAIDESFEHVFLGAESAASTVVARGDEVVFLGRNNGANRFIRWLNADGTPSSNFGIGGDVALPGAPRLWALSAERLVVGHTNTMLE